MRDEILSVFAEIEQRLNGLAPRLAGNGAEARLPGGEWSVRDALCHVAARSNDVPRFVVMAEQEAAGPPPAIAGAAPPDMNEINNNQISERTGRSLDDLLDETRHGLRAARLQVEELSDAELGRSLTDMRTRQPSTLGAMLGRVYRLHLGGHLDEIAQAVEGAPA